VQFEEAGHDKVRLDVVDKLIFPEIQPIQQNGNREKYF
jgi:hypothetical protein